MDAHSYQGPLDALTWRERDILALLAERRTNREIAGALGLELTTVKWYNGEIYDKLGVSNRREAAARAQELGLLEGEQAESARTPGEAQHNLPAPVTSFVGREAEVAQVVELLAKPTIRLLTLIGPPGTGKTRLSLAVAAQHVNRFDDGVFFARLAPLEDPELVPNAIADALGVKEVGGQPVFDALKAHLSRKRALLLLDNFEHVLQAGPLLSELLAAAPDLKLLVTSREPLQLYGENEFYVSPLALPDVERDGSPSMLAQVEAVALFIERARAINPDFDLTGDNSSLVADICVRLDGLPLAIELAAARVRLLPLVELRERLSSRLDTLRGGMRDLSPRHQTLRATIDWSYHLLDEGEQTLFNRLGVFRGGCTLESAEAVCGPGLSIPVLEGLEGLLNRSLLNREREGGDGPRFTFLETLREYALDCLEAGGETGATRRRHATFFADLVDEAEGKIRTRQQNVWLVRLDAEHDNLRAALDWTLDGGDPGLGLRLAGALFRFWYQHSHGTEGRRWLERALQNAPADAPPWVRARALTHAAILVEYLGLADHPHMAAWADEGLALYQQLGDEMGEALALAANSGVHIYEGDIDSAEGLAEQAVTLARKVGDPDTIGMVVVYAAEWARVRGEFQRALDLHSEGLAISQELDNRFLTALELLNLGLTCQSLGERERTETFFRDALGMAWEQGQRDMMGFCVAGMACVAVDNGHPGRAARLLGASETLHEASGMHLQPQDQAIIEPCLHTARDQLAGDTFKALWEEGRAMTEEQTIAYALGESKA